jgi:dihydroorotase-like cyclic amidohydrolase
MLSSDHAPHTREEKEVGWTDAWAAHTGTPGIQDQLPLMINAMHEGRITVDRLVDLVSTAPARLFGLDRKGTLAPGADADIALLDLNREWAITNEAVESKIGWTPYHGRKVKGAIARTMVRGVDVWVDDKVVGTPGHGQLVRSSLGGQS